MMDKMKFESPDMTTENIEKIAALFPNCITEMRDENGKLKRGINFEMLKQMLSPDVVDGDECYEFTWVGKKAAIVEANKPIRKTLRPCPEESKNWETTENLYIEGDNLEVLKLLQESYLGKVKMIYIRIIPAMISSMPTISCVRRKKKTSRWECMMSMKTVYLKIPIQMGVSIRIGVA